VKLKRLFEAAGGARRQLFVGPSGSSEEGDPQGPLGGGQHGAWKIPESGMTTIL